MRPSSHVRWSAERLLELVRDEQRLHAAQRREAVFGLLGLPLLFALALVGDDGTAPRAVPSLQALALVAVVVAVVLWFRLLRAPSSRAARLDDFGDGEPIVTAGDVKRRLTATRDELLVRARELRAESLRRAGLAELSWWATLAAVLLLVLVFALRWLG